jgi:hypothetical protein
VDVSVAPPGVVAATSLGRVLLGAAARALRDVYDLGDAHRERRRPALDRRPMDAELAGGIDADAVAGWMAGHYPRRSYPGVVLGSPHGASVHLAAALGMPWLPMSFEVSVAWPEGSPDDALGALTRGSRTVDRLLVANPRVAVRQIHHPGERAGAGGCTLTLVVRWLTVPTPYRRFLASCLAPQAPVLLISDGRGWPALDVDDRHAFQIGGAGTGLRPADFGRDSDLAAQMLRIAGGDWDRWNPPEGARPSDGEHGLEPGFDAGLRAWARPAGHAVHRVLYPGPGALSAAVADIYRDWLRVCGKPADRCVVAGGRLVDAGQVLRAGLVPYWCADPSRRCVAGAEAWLAGSRRFATVDVLPEAPGRHLPVYAGLDQWRAVAWFGKRRGTVDPVAARGYPTTPVSGRHATEVLRRLPSHLPRLLPLTASSALAGLGPDRAGSGLLLS